MRKSSPTEKPADFEEEHTDEMPALSSTVTRDAIRASQRVAGTYSITNKPKPRISVHVLPDGRIELLAEAGSLVISVAEGQAIAKALLRIGDHRDR